jgi:hypothetical protein
MDRKYCGIAQGYPRLLTYWPNAPRRKGHVRQAPGRDQGQVLQIGDWKGHSATRGGVCVMAGAGHDTGVAMTRGLS